jgi:hypothetical protein
MRVRWWRVFGLDLETDRSIAARAEYARDGARTIANRADGKGKRVLLDKISPDEPK